MTIQELSKDDRINISAIARDIGMNESVLRAYSKGLRTPSTKQINRIQKGVDNLKQFLSEVKLEI